VLGVDGEVRAERLFRPEDLLVEQRDEAEQLREIVLERGGRQQQLRRALEPGLERLARLVPRLVGVAQPVRLDRKSVV
jgi:hypothetical protein